MASCQFAIGVLAVLAGLLAGCTDEGPVAQEREAELSGREPLAERPPRDRRVQAFDCSGGRYVVSEFQPDADRMVLFLPGRTLFLSHVSSGSGTKYSDGRVTFWSKADEALLDLPGESGLECKINRRATILESAKLDGADLWAMGNEPGWTLTVYPDKMILVSAYGQQRHEVEIQELDEDRERGSTRILGWANDGQMIVTLRSGPCTDSMSGESFQARVEIEWIEQSLEGCGLPLH